ncbi:MAG: hypothetical protein HPZ91_12075 [Lentisphaeria bacterium]|nr:hypothetical protein [Lentisphaeria bacterium]
MLNPRKLIFSFAAAGLLAGCCAAAQESIATTPVSGLHETTGWRNFWPSRWKQKLGEAKKLGGQVRVVFLGDSITHFWDTTGHKVFEENFSRYHTLNLGFSGDRTQQTLWIARESGIFQLVRPGLVVLMIGTNNVGWKESGPKEAAEGIRQILAAVRKNAPQAKILLFAVFPRGKNDNDAMRRKVAEINRELPALADGKDIFYVDINSKLMNADGTIDAAMMPDYLHPAQAGYLIWRDAILPYAEKYAGGK